MMINASVNAKNQLIKVHVIKNLFGILGIVSANPINHVMLVNIQTIKALSAEKNQLINQFTNLLNVQEAKIAEMALFEHEIKCVCSRTICIVLTAISIGTGAYFVYSHWYLKEDDTRIKFGTCTQTTI